MSFATLPGVQLSWTKPTIAAGSTFVRYNVYVDRQDGAGNIRIATISDYDTNTYTDYAGRSGVSYTYGASYVVNTAGTLLESVQATVSGSVTFAHTGPFIHYVGDSSDYGEFPSSQFDASFGNQETQYLRARGRQTPTAFVGEAEGGTIRLTPKLRNTSNMEMWTEVLDLIALQRTSSAVLCMRSSHNSPTERYFVVFDAQQSRTDRPYIYNQSLSFRQVYYTEVV